MSMNQVVAGFSKTNRWLIYTSAMLAPAQGAAGLGSNCPSNLGFLAFNIYQQVLFFRAVKNKELHALTMVLASFNAFNNFIYIFGVVCANPIMAGILTVATSALMILNNISAWISWATNMPEGYGKFQFFFFGWRSLSPGWHKFMLAWTIGDTLFTIFFIGLAIAVAVKGVEISEGLRSEKKKYWWIRYPVIPVGAALVMLIYWLGIMWTELIISRNHIGSDTDWIAVWLFIAQVVSMLIPMPCI